MSVYRISFPLPPMEVLEDARIESHDRPIIDELTGFPMLSTQVGFQNGLKKNREDPGSWEESKPFPSKTIPGGLHLQVIPFGGENLP